MTFATLCGLEVIRFLSAAPAPTTSSQISAATGISRATVYRTVNELVEAGWLVEEGSPRRFSPSWKVTELGLDMLVRNHVREIALRSLIDLASETGRPAFLSFRDGGDTLSIDSVEVVGGRIMPAALHSRVPALLTSAGRCILARLPEAETERLIRAGVPTPTEGAPAGADYIRGEIQAARERGYGVCDGEITAEWVSLSAAVLDGNDRPLGALGISAPQPRGPVEAQYGDTVRQWARRASIELGYRGSRPFD